MSIFLLPYKAGSEGAKAISNALGIKQLKLQNSNFKPSKRHTVINWGNSDVPKEYKEKCLRVLNFSINCVSNKLEFFRKIKDKEYCIPFSESKEEAKDMLNNGLVVCRTVLNGHSGNGIIISETEEELVDAKLYTKYIPKKEEYRVHVMNGEAFHIQRKARKLDVPDDEVNWKVRNNANGFIYATDNVIAPKDVIDCAIDSVKTCELDFGAVDVIWNEKNQKAYVLEINSAPGVTGRTLEAYKEAFEEILL